MSHISVITPAFETHISEITPNDAVPADYATKCSTLASSGAAAAKRKQLMQNTLRQGFHEQFFINQYREKKKEKEHKREEFLQAGGASTDIPEDLRRQWPAYIPPKRANLAATRTQRVYNRGQTPDLQKNIEVGETAGGLE